jgi:ribosomal protein RSM22 (predicted rRNA methylase)
MKSGSVFSKSEQFQTAIELEIRPSCHCSRISQVSMKVSLPLALAAAIEQRLEGVSRKELAARAQAFSEAYRGGGTSRSLATEHDILAYLVARLPATYAAVRAAFEQVREALPEFAPQSLRDVGAGPGAASWAALNTWPKIGAATLLDHNAPFLTVAQALAIEHPVLSRASVVTGDVASAAPPADLVVASYVLAELPEPRAADLARQLFETATHVLMLVEPGTPAGFARVRAAREALVAAGAHVVAPCTHGKPCPMQAPDWCHFSQRLPRSRDHMIAKDASVPFEDERYSYIAVSREAPPPANRARIIAPPKENKAGLTIPICDENGLHRGVILKRDRFVFDMMRKAKWGDVILSEE